MDKTVVSLFNDFSQATAAIGRLEDAGISSRDISMFTTTAGENRYWDGTTGYDTAGATTTDATSSRLASYLTSVGVPDGDAHAYAEGVRRGGALVVVRCSKDKIDRVTQILDGGLDIDESQSAWRAEGWQGTHRDASTSDAGEREEVIPLAQEELQVGKREVNHGRVRIHSYVVETPVQEQVTLRDEHIEVDRRAADRPVSGSDPFRERTIEVEERDEEAAVTKEARVTEELVVRKDVDHRAETVSDTVRRTEVEVDDQRDNRKTGTTGRDRI